MLKKFPVVWYRVIIVSALSLTLRDKEREREKREIEIELDNDFKIFKSKKSCLYNFLKSSRVKT